MSRFRLELALGAVAGVLLISIVLSLMFPKKQIGCKRRMRSKYDMPVYSKRILSPADHGMLAVLRVVLQRMIQAVVRAAAFFASQRRACDQQSSFKNVGRLMRAAIADAGACACSARNSGTTCCSALPSRTTPTCCHISD